MTYTRNQIDEIEDMLENMIFELESVICPEVLNDETIEWEFIYDDELEFYSKKGLFKNDFYLLKRKHKLFWALDTDGAYEKTIEQCRKDCIAMAKELLKEIKKWADIHL